MSTGILSLLSKVRPPVNLIDFMNQAPFDELINVDLGQDRYKFIFNLDEKYQVTTTEGVFSQFYAQIIREIVHPDDRRLYADTMDPATIARRLAEAEVPGALVFQYRIQDLNGGWRWIE